ncbi:MAG: DUF452 family protein [Muribaculum sp.]|nr:DUF452 family protein [Muribaculum sp.]
MKLEFIKRGAATRLILIFAGWSTNRQFYEDCVVDGWDTAVISDYRDMTLPDIPCQYGTIYVFAYSLGVWAASITPIDAAVRVAIFGTGTPVSDQYGIPKSIFIGTADNLTDTTLKKFHSRMSGNKQQYETDRDKLPENPDIAILKEELYAIAENAEKQAASDHKWHRAYISMEDRIIPTANQQKYWEKFDNTEIIELESPHYVDISKIIKECVPNPKHIGEGFANAKPTYKKYAIVQAEVCNRIGSILDEILESGLNKTISLLEIGPGKGMLTEEWCKRIHPQKATYVDLYDMQLFDKAEEERYLIRDAETWLEETGDNFDVILSASAMQWFANPIKFIDAVWNHLNPGGIAILSTFIKGNLRELDSLRPSPIIYHTSEEYIEGVYKATGEVYTQQWTSILEFDSPRELLLHLKNTGVQPYMPHNRLITKEPIKLTALPKQLTYKPLIIKMTKQ